jgi:hypothetical protein
VQAIVTLATPVGGRALLKAMDSLGRDEEAQVLPDNVKQV